MFEQYTSKQGVSSGSPVQVDVTFVRIWHRRGHKSNFGNCAVIDLDTGLVLDYHVCSKLCPLCTAKVTAMRKGKISQNKYIQWPKEDHPGSDCKENYERPLGRNGGSCCSRVMGQIRDI